MKTLLQFFLALGLLLSLNACESSDIDEKTVMNDTSNEITDDGKILSESQISPDSARVWMARWEAEKVNYIQQKGLTYFDMPILDLKAIDQNKRNKTSRFYLGLEQRNEGEGLVAHLILVGLDSANKPDLQAAYDYTNVCPPLCTD